MKSIQLRTLLIILLVCVLAGLLLATCSSRDFTAGITAMLGKTAEDSAAPAATEPSSPEPAQSHAPTAGTTQPATPSPSPSPSPTPTPDPEAQFFSESGEVCDIDPDGLHWTYKSPTLGVFIEKIIDDKKNLAYYVANIYVRDFSLLSAGFANKKPQGKPVQKPDQIARLYNAVYAQNGDYYLDNPSSALIIRDGVTYRNKKQKDDVLAFAPDGTMLVFHPGAITRDELLEMGIVNTFNFGPILVENGKLGSLKNTHEISGGNPRSGFGMVTKGHYIGIVVDTGVTTRRGGPTLADFAKMFLDRGCTVAYNFDGGQSAAMVFMGKMISTAATSPKKLEPGKNWGGQRSITDIFYIGTSDLVQDK